MYIRITNHLVSKTPRKCYNGEKLNYKRSRERSRINQLYFESIVFTMLSVCMIFSGRELIAFLPFLRNTKKASNNRSEKRAMLWWMTTRESSG